MSAVATRRALALEHFHSDRFQRKLFRAMAIVETALTGAIKPYVAFTSGKDSMCVAALVERMSGADITAAWSDDEVEYPETVAIMETLALSGSAFIVTRGGSIHAGWFRPWQDRPFWREPLSGMRRITQPQDDYMASKGYDLTFTGLRREESRKRRDWLLTVEAENGLPLYHVKTGTGLRCCPLAAWTADDVWALIHGWGLPINPVYDRLEEIGISRERQRVGPLPLTPRSILAEGWPEVLQSLEARYGPRWS